MEIALKRYEQDLAEKRTRRKNDLDNLERGVEREKERVAKEKEAVTNLKKIQMQSLDDQVEQKKAQAVHDQRNLITSFLHCEIHLDQSGIKH